VFGEVGASVSVDHSKQTGSEQSASFPVIHSQPARRDKRLHVDSSASAHLLSEPLQQPGSGVGSAQRESADELHAQPKRDILLHEDWLAS